jgi:hypothetical protein
VAIQHPSWAGDQSPPQLTRALALEESHRHDPYHIETKAREKEGIYKISGKKTFVLDGHVADKLIVVTRTSGKKDSRDGLTLFLIDRKTKGVKVARTKMADSRNAANIQFRRNAHAVADTARSKRALSRDDAADEEQVAGPNHAQRCRRGAGRILETLFARRRGSLQDAKAKHSGSGHLNQLTPRRLSLASLCHCPLLTVPRAVSVCSWILRSKMAGTCKKQDLTPYPVYSRWQCNLSRLRPCTVWNP